MKRLKKHEATIEALLNYVPPELKEDIRHDLVAFVLAGEAKDRRSLRRARDRFHYNYKKHIRREIQISTEVACPPAQDALYSLSLIYQRTSGFKKLELQAILAVIEAIMAGSRFPCSEAAKSAGVSRVRVGRILGKLANSKPNPKLSEIRDVLEFRRLIKKRIKRK